MTDLILTEDDYRQLVQSNDGKPTTDSLKVADKFGKRHDNVLRSIDNLKCSEKFRLLNFEEIFYHDEYGRPQRMFTMTKDGYMYLVMGLTGKKAAVWKEAFIEAFNWMTEELTFRSLSYEQRRNYIISSTSRKRVWQVSQARPCAAGRLKSQSSKVKWRRLNRMDKAYCNFTKFK